MASVGERYRRFIERHEVAWELGFAALAIAFVVSGFAPEDQYPWIATVDWMLTIVFILEFTTRIAVARSRRDYLSGHWVDLVALVPPARGLRVLRLARLLRLVRAFAGLGRALASLQRLANHQGLMWLFIAWGTVMVVCSIALYVAEVGPNGLVDDPLDALWWGITTMTTVGYGDVYPVTPEGRLAAGVLMVLGIGLYSAVTATLTSALMARRDSRGDAVGTLRQLAALRDEGLIDDELFDAKRAELLERL